MSYKISKSSAQELQRAVNKFNSKIKRLENVDGEIGIPEKESIKAIKDRVSSKWDLNREINRLERFTKRNAEDLIKNKYGVVMTRWEYENIQKEQKRLTARLTRDIERYSNIKPKEFGKVQSVTYAQMGDEKLSNLKARKNAISNKNVMKMNKEQLRNLQSIINKTSANYRKPKELFYNNYLDGTLLNTAYFVGYDSEKIEYIKKKLSELTPAQFARAFEQEQALKDIQLRYDLTKEDGITPDILSGDITPILDTLYENIDQIVDSYK